MRRAFAAIAVLLTILIAWQLWPRRASGPPTPSETWSIHGPAASRGLSRPPEPTGDKPSAWLEWSDDLPQQPRFLRIGSLPTESPPQGSFLLVHVDPEAFPDVAETYAAAALLVTQRWERPVHVWTLPDGRPFGATHWLPQGELAALVARVESYWQADPERVEADARQIHERLLASLPEPVEELPSSPAVLPAVAAAFDRAFGGFGGPAKVPNAGLLLWLLALPDAPEARHMAVHTVLAMAHGAIRDHLTGAFFSMSTSPDWTTPHMEIRTDVNAELALACLTAGEATGQEEFFDVARAILEFLGRQMQHQDGTFATSLSGEPDYFTWAPSEFFRALGQDRAEVLAPYLRILPGHRSVPFPVEPPEDRAESLGRDPAEFRRMLAGAWEDLLAERQRRPGLRRDDRAFAASTVMAAWAFAHAARVFDDPALRQTAVRALGAVPPPVTLPDHAVLALAHLALDDADSAAAVMDHALLALAMPTGWLRWSPRHLFVDLPDGRGNGLAALALARLGRTESARAILRAVGGLFERDPFASQWLLYAAWELERR